MKPGVVYDRRFAEHSMGPYHAESPERVLVLNRMLEEEAGRRVPSGRAPAGDRRGDRLGSRARLHRFSQGDGGPRLGLPRRGHVRGGQDLRDGPSGGRRFPQALDLILEGRVRNALALVRPPGHHAEAARAMGFCFFNNVAVGAEHLIRRHGLRRVLIVDWDLHHGNGTQHAFYSRPDVLYFSTHQVPLYPGTGAIREIGDGPGEGLQPERPPGRRQGRR